MFDTRHKRGLGADVEVVNLFNMQPFTAMRGDYICRRYVSPSAWDLHDEGMRRRVNEPPLSVRHGE
jgi:hypothetical protein